MRQFELSASGGELHYFDSQLPPTHHILSHLNCTYHFRLNQLMSMGRPATRMFNGT